jgi:hypothetical protein
MKIRRFTKQGHEEYKSLYREIVSSIENKNGNIKNGYTPNLKKKIKDMQNRKDNSVEIEKSQQILNSDFSSSYELGVHLVETLKDLSYSDIQGDSEMWDWLVLFYFDLIFSEKMRGYSELRYILNQDWKLVFRHLARTPWWCVQYYGKYSKLLLCEEPYRSIDWLEQYIKNRDIREFKPLIKICYEMYFDKKNEKYKPGTSKGKSGALFRLRDKINQFFRVYDLWHMSAQEIIDLLPKEFDLYKPKKIK